MFRCCVWLPESIFSRDAGCLQPHAEIMWPSSSNTFFVYVSEVWNCVKHYMLVAEHASRSNIEYMERLDKLEVPYIAQFSLVCSRPSWLVAAFNPVIQWNCQPVLLLMISYDITIADGYTTRMPKGCYFNPICVGKLGYNSLLCSFRITRYFKHPEMGLTENRAQSLMVIIFPWTNCYFNFKVSQVSNITNIVLGWLCIMYINICNIYIYSINPWMPIIFTLNRINFLLLMDLNQFSSHHIPSYPIISHHIPMKNL